MAIKGIDVSVWQGNIDFGKVMIEELDRIHGFLLSCRKLYQ